MKYIFMLSMLLISTITCIAMEETDIETEKLSAERTVGGGEANPTKYFQIRKRLWEKEQQRKQEKDKQEEALKELYKLMAQN